MITENLLFDTISLTEAKRASLLNRIDSKYLIPRSRLDDLYSFLGDDYSVVEIDSLHVLPYKTIYFDTPEHHYYHTHHNGKLNRYKFRSREYLVGGQIFNEVKFKENRGKTFKSRIERVGEGLDFDSTFHKFASKKCPSIQPSLQPQLQVLYDRMTLVSNQFNERITIDTNLRCSHNGKVQQFDTLGIVELKRERDNRNTIGERALNTLRSKKTGFSKYCIGIASTRDSVKKNNFKEKLRMVDKLCGTDRSL